MRTTAEKIEVMQAFVDGKKIEALPGIGGNGKWVDWQDPNWDWDCCDYRVKPQEPREWWTCDFHMAPLFTIRDGVEIFLYMAPLFTTRYGVENFLKTMKFEGGKIIRVREVIERTHDHV